MNSLYCTADRVGIESGGGIVTRQEVEALRTLGEVTVLGADDFQAAADPAAVDDAAAGRVGTLLIHNRIKRAHFYAGMFTKTVRRLRKARAFVSYTAAAHDLAESIREFELLGLTYPHAHMRDPVRLKEYVAGYREANLVVCPSEMSAKVMRGFGCKKVTVIPHGTELPAQVAPLPKRFVVAYLGQTGPDKGLIYLIRAWRAAGLRDARLVMAGRGTEDLAPLVRAEGGGNVQLCGFVRRPSEVYNACSVYVQPSVTEGFGIEILEAMAHGRAVIASKGAGAAEVVEDGVTGFVVPPRDPAALLERIAWLEKNPDAAASFGVAGREKAARFTWDKIRAQYVKVWKAA